MVNGMKHTEIGDIPENWQVQTFEETFKVLPNNTLPRANLNNRGGSVRNVHYGDILVRFPEVLDCKTEDIPYLNDAALITANVQFLQDGDVLLADTAEDEAVGKATEIYGLGDGKMVAGLHTIPCRVKKGDFAPKWLGYYMNSHAYHNQIMPYVTGIKVSSISKSAIAETLVLVPPKQEQEAIVAALSDIDTLIANLEKLVAKYQMIKQGCLEKMFPRNGQNEPEIRLPGFSGAWEQRRLGDIANIVGGGTPSTSNTDYWDGEIDWYSPAEIADQIYVNSSIRKITQKGFENSSAQMLPIGTVLFTSRAGIGKTAILHKEGCTNQGFQSIVPQKNELDSYFIFSRTEELKRYGETKGAGSTFVEVSGKQMASMELMMPKNYEEQQSIGAYFKHLDNLITLHQRKLEKYKMIKQGMMSELLTGKTRLI